MAYVGMVIKLDSPSRRQERILNECLGTEEPPTEGTQNEDRVLPFMTRKDLVAATITLGTRVSKIVECHIEKEIERKKVGTQTVNHQDASIQSSNETQASQRGMIVQLAVCCNLLSWRWFICLPLRAALSWYACTCGQQELEPAP